MVKVRRLELPVSTRARTAAHIRYIARDGAARNGGPPEYYLSDDDHADIKAFAQRCERDPGHFAITVSPEDGDQLSDLRPFVRKLMAEVEQDLGTRLDWIAVDHFDTGRPHSHILLRGADEMDRPLLIAQNYITHGIRDRACEQIVAELGPALDKDRLVAMRREVSLEMPIALDRKLFDDLSAAGQVCAIQDDPFEQSLRTRRLRALELMGLARSQGALIWRLEEDFMGQLEGLQNRRVRLERMRHIMIDRGQLRGTSEFHVLDLDQLPPEGLAGALVKNPERGTAKAQLEIMLDSIDGRVYSIDLSEASGLPEMQAGMVIRISSDPEARVGEPGTDDSPSDRGVIKPAIAILSRAPLDRLPDYDGPTWLDELKADTGLPPIRDAGFGRELRAAQRQRAQWLMEQGLGDESSDMSRLLPVLRQREFFRLTGQVSDELGLENRDTAYGSAFKSGTLLRSIDLPRGRFALFEHGHQFRLVPWEPAFEKYVRPDHSGVEFEDDAPEWQRGRGREGPTIS